MYFSNILRTNLKRTNTLYMRFVNGCVISVICMTYIKRIPTLVRPSRLETVTKTRRNIVCYFDHPMCLIFVDCGTLNFSSSSGDIQTPGYPSIQYPDNLHCKWQIFAPNGSTVRCYYMFVHWLTTKPIFYLIALIENYFFTGPHKIKRFTYLPILNFFGMLAETGVFF